MRARLALVLLAVCLPVAVALDDAGAQMANPQPLTKPVDAKWRKPFVRFLHDLGTQDAERLVAGTRTASLGGDPETVVVRLEDQSTCKDGLCLTIIGSIESGDFHSLAMLFAPAFMTSDDVSPTFLGQSRRPPVFFFENANPQNPGRAISALETPKGWIVVPGR